MTSLIDIAQRNPTWSLEEFVEVANQLLPQYLPIAKGNTRVREDINPRLVRHYTSQGMLDEPLKQGKYAMYIYRHLLQLLVVRRLLSDGMGANAINQLATQKSNTELETLLTVGVQIEVTPANPALAYLEQLKTRSSRTAISSTPTANAPAIPQTDLLKNKSSHWTRLDILPGLEIHIRSDFTLPATPGEQQSLKQQLWQVIQTFLTRNK